MSKLLELKDKIGFEGLDLLFNLLELDPQRRISAELALNHSFFDSVRATQQSDRYDLSVVPMIQTYQGELPLCHY